jgi:hypothetical protein
LRGAAGVQYGLMAARLTVIVKISILTINRNPEGALRKDGN